MGRSVDVARPFEVNFRWARVAGLCKTAYYFWYLCCFLSGWFVLAVSLERCRVVYNPFSARRLGRPQRLRIIAAITLIGALYSTWITLMLQRPSHGTHCEPTHFIRFYNVFNLIDTLVAFTVPLLAVFALNCAIICRLRGATLDRKNLSHPQTSRQTIRAQQLGRERESVFANTAHKSSVNGVQKCAYGKTVISAPTVPTQIRQIPEKGGRLLIAEGPNGGRNDGRRLLSAESRQDPSRFSVCGGRGCGWKSGRVSAFRSLMRRREWAERRATLTLLSLSAAYCLLNFPTYAARLYEEILLWGGLGGLSPAWLWFKRELATLFFYTQFSLNFLLYSLHWLCVARPFRTRRPSPRTTTL